MVTTEQTQVPEVVAQADDNHEAKKSPQESFAELRKAKDDVERQLWQAQKELELRDKMQVKAAPVAPPEEEFDFRQLEQEEFPDGKKLLKAFNQVNKKLSTYDQKLAARDQKIEILEAVQNLPGFIDVVTAENIEKYIKSDEDNIESMQKAENPLRKAYNLIKKDARYQADLAAKSSKSKPVSQEQQRVDEKDTKPRTGSMGVRSEAVSTAAGLSNSKMSKDQRNTLWKETQALARK
jgi:hypothetical protein